MANLAKLFGDRFVDNPGFLERIDIGISNIPVVIGIFLIFIFLKRRRPSMGPSFFLFLCLIPTVIRYLGGYPYGSNIAFVSWIADFTIVTLLLFAVGRIVTKNRNLIELITVGAGTIISGGVLLIFFGAQSYLGPPRVLVSIICLGSMAFFLFRNSHHFPSEKAANIRFKMNSAVLLCGVLIFIAPILPYLFTPSPPDVDISAMKEILGFVFQGQRLESVQPGPIGEYYSIRYPWGVPAIAWVWGHFLHIGASESLTLLWLAAWGLLICNIANVCEILGGVAWLALLFTFNSTFVGPFGLTGGQVQEMLAYALGVGFISQVLNKRFLTAGILLSASMVTHPIVAIPFCLVWGLEFLFLTFRLIRKREPIYTNDCIGFVFVVMAILYLASLSMGEVEFPSHPQMMISALTYPKFFKNIIYWLNADTFNFSAMCFALLVPCFTQINRMRRRSIAILIFWFIGACLINGLFGSTKEFNYTATFQAGFSVCAIWVLSVSLLPEITRFFIFKSKKFVSVALMLLWIIFLLPSITWNPVSVFVTHSDIEASKYLSKSTSPTDLIGVICPYSVLWGNKRTYYTMIRGDSYRNNLYSIISAHQVKNGHFVTKPILDDILRPDTSFLKLKEVLKLAGVTHLMVASRPETMNWIGEASNEAIFKSGNSFVFKLK